MLLIIRSCFLIFIAKECFAGSMSKEDLKGFDEHVRAELTIRIAEDVKLFTKQLGAVNDGCARKINDTADQCRSCPTPKGGSKKSGLDSVIGLLKTPIEHGKAMFNSIKNTISSGNVLELLGQKAAMFHPLLNKNLMNPLIDISSKLGNVLGSLRDSVARIPSLIGNGVSSLVGTISDGLGSIFGRRKRSVCGLCGKLDPKNIMATMIHVCGADVAKRSNDLQKKLGKLNILIKAVNGTILKQINTGAPRMVLSPVFAVSAGLQSITYSIGSTTKTLKGGSKEKIVFTNKRKSYPLLADKIYNDFM